MLSAEFLPVLFLSKKFDTRHKSSRTASPGITLRAVAIKGFDDKRRLGAKSANWSNQEYTWVLITIWPFRWHCSPMAALIRNTMQLFYKFKCDQQSLILAWKYRGGWTLALWYKLLCGVLDLIKIGGADTKKLELLSIVQTGDPLKNCTLLATNSFQDQTDRIDET